MIVQRIGLDVGNANLKVATKNFWGKFTHRVAFLSEAQYSTVLARTDQRTARANDGDERNGYAKVTDHESGKVYYIVVGFDATRHMVTVPKGAQRYKRDYYGVLGAFMLATATRKARETYSVCATHAPNTVQYRNDIRESLMGNWTIERITGTKHITVSEVMLIDEPVAGYHNGLITIGDNDQVTSTTHITVLNEVGKPVQQKASKTFRLNRETWLVIDIGGFTTDAVPIDDGKIDVTALDSVVVGADDVRKDFEQRLRAKFPKEFKMADVLDARRLEDALREGRYPYGNRYLDVQDIAFESKMMLFNDVQGIVQRYGGALNYNGIYLTGGGGLLFLSELRMAFPEMNIALAHEDASKLIFANAMGAYRFARLIAEAQKKGK